jgi:hypothetical protein
MAPTWRYFELICCFNTFVEFYLNKNHMVKIRSQVLVVATPRHADAYRRRRR